MKTLSTAFENLPLVASIPPEALKALIINTRIKKRTYGRDEIIHMDGDRCHQMELILSGNVIIERIDSEGNLLTITEFFPGDLIGGNLLFSKNPHYPLTVTAKQPVILLEFSKEMTFELCKRYPEFLACYLEYISDHTLLLGDKIKHYVQRTIRESLMAYLESELKRQGVNPIRLSISKKALAERIGVQRTSLSRELQKMKHDGLIDYDATHIKLL